VAILGGLAAFYDVVRRAMSARIDNVVAQHMLEAGGVHYKFKAVTRVTQVTPIMDTWRLVQRSLEQIETRVQHDIKRRLGETRTELQRRSRLALSAAFAAVLVVVILAAAVLAAMNKQLHLRTQGMLGFETRFAQNCPQAVKFLSA
jgi:hypothetical protein